MGIFSKAIPAGDLKLSDVIPKYDRRMTSIINIGKHMYRGYLPDSALTFGEFNYLSGFHDYKIYTKNKYGGKARRKTLQVPKFTTEHLTKLIYTEKVKSIVQSESEPEVARVLQEYLKEVLGDNDYWNNTASLTEVMFNLGGKVEYPTIKNGKLCIEFVTAERFFPIEWTNKEVTSGIISSNFTNNGYYYTKLLWFEQKGVDYIIRKELYKSKSETKLGYKVSYKSMFDDPDVITLRNFTTVPFTYTKPRIKNNQAFQSPLGLPIWFNAIDIIGDIDLIFDRKHTEVKYGGRQKIVPQYTMKQKKTRDSAGNITTEHNVFDPDDPTFSSINIDPQSHEKSIVDLTSPIRDVSFISLLNNSLDMISVMLGFNTGTFVFDGKSMKTATEVITEKQATYQTKVNQERALEIGHINLFKYILELAIAMELDPRVRRLPEDLEIKVQFDDSIIVDKEKQLNDMQTDVNEERVADWRLVAERYNLSREEAIEWVKEAKANSTDMSIEAILSGEDEE